MSIKNRMARSGGYDGDPIQHYVQQCGGKNCYGKKAAERIAVNVMRKRSRKVHVYECELCHYYHLTSIDYFGPNRIGRTDKPGRKHYED